MNCILCNKFSNNIKLYNGNPLCEECLLIQKKLVSEYSSKRQKFYPECDEILKNKLYLGNNDFAINKKLLQEKGIKKILVCGEELECKFPNDFKYLKINLNDYIEETILPYIEKCVNFIDESGEKVFVHCNAGVSRSSSIVIAYLIKKKDYNFEEAFNFVKNKRKVINPNEKFLKELQSLNK